jgi:hypothetical protein
MGLRVFSLLILISFYQSCTPFEASSQRGGAAGDASVVPPGPSPTPEPVPPLIEVPIPEVPVDSTPINPPGGLVACGVGAVPKGTPAEFTMVAPDPAGGGAGLGGFGRIHWLSSINRVLSPFGFGPSMSDNSLQTYDPVADKWDVPAFWPSSVYDGPQNRDNQGSFYIPTLDEFWIWGGSHLEEVYLPTATAASGTTLMWSGKDFTSFFPAGSEFYLATHNSNGTTFLGTRLVASSSYSNSETRVAITTDLPADMSNVKIHQALYSGRFNVSQRRWLKPSPLRSVTFGDVLEGELPYPGADPGTAWNEKLDTGMICCGSSQGNPSNAFFLIEPNPSGNTRYRVVKLSGGLPPARDQAMNLLVAAENDFYLFAGGTQYVNSQGTAVYWSTGDFWKFNGLTRTWTELPAPPLICPGYLQPSHQATLTYDSEQKRIVAWVYDKIFAFRLSTGQWEDVTPTNLSCIFNAMGVYSPSAKKHIYQGGNYCSSGSSVYSTFSLTLK